MTYSMGVLLVMLLLNSTPVGAQSALTLSGVVFEMGSGRPVESAKVIVVGGKANSEVTDSEGSFVLTFNAEVKPGSTVRIRVEKQGYKPFDKLVPVSSTIPLRISLQPLGLRMRDRHLEDQKKETAAKLKMTMFFPTSHDVFKSGVTITNGGGTAITSQRVLCYMRRVMVTITLPSGDKSDRTIQHMPEVAATPEKVTLGPDGDEETVYCMEGWEIDGAPICADVTVVFYYSLTTQPATENWKRLRFVGRNEGLDFVWRGQPVDNPADFCPNPPNVKREAGRGVLEN